MAVFKCKMCGGTLNIENGVTVAECEFCGRKQTIPKLDDEKRANLYDRANHFRRTNDYDKAMGIYEIILNEDKTDAEAYWSILLCKYGVEYVEDPATHKRVPTINRTQFTSILKDVDYKNALKYADGYQRDIYEEEAKEIDKIQKGILAISGKEEPFDVFICYKETDHSGRRTIDSVLAQDLYHNLKNEGLKVFFSRITLEDKLGVAYEPYIFAALNSAKVMVVIGSKLEYFNAVWVKNEWSRYLSLIRSGEKKTLIPAYKDMDPYDLPEEFTHLQAQDMNKLGFMQDLVYGIKKIIGRNAPKTVVKETVVVDNHHDTAPLLRRAYLFLEDGDFDSANEYAEKVLDSNPECAEAYFIKLLAEIGVRKPELLLQSETDISEYSNYKRALRFADNKFGEELSNYNDAILDNIENRRKENVYQSACANKELRLYEEAIEIFKTVIDYKDSASKIEECNELIETERKEMVYNNAISRVSISNASDVALKQSISDLQSISGYKNADGKVAELQARLEKYYHDKRVAEEQAKIRAEEERLRKLREAELRKIKLEKRKQKIKKTAKIGVPSILALTLVLVLTFTLFIPLGKYNKANDLLNSGNYEEAIKIYEDLGGFSGSEAKIATINAVKTVENGDFEQGIKDALNVGAKVNLTYEFAGGYFVASQSSGGASPMSCTLYTEEKPETEKTYTYTKIEDFSGLKTPERSGYYFQKWELVSCNAEVTSKDNTLNLRLVAIWSANKYIITYDLDGGSVSSPNPIGYNPDDLAFTLINPTRTGYTFIGWTGTDLEEKTMTVTIVSGSYGNRSYTANWQANTYTVTYDANGGIASKTQDTATYDSEFVLATAERRGYTFIGWYIGNTKYENFDRYNLVNGLGLTAKWQINTYTITYNLNGGSATNVDEYTVEDAVTITEPTRTGYKFDGWTGTDLSDNTTNLSLLKGTIGNKEYTANWTAKTYTVTYNGNGGTPSKTSDTATYDEYLTLATAERRGYKFDGWKADNKIYTSGDWKTDKSVILVAQWSIIKYNFTYNLDGGSATNVATYTVNDTITLNNPTRAGYTFTGWTYSGQTTPTKTVSFSNEIGNKTFTANWQANLNTIIFNSNGGVGEMPQQQIYTDSTEKLNVNEFAKHGYTFMGWATSSTGSVVYYDGESYKMGANSVYNLYAIWSRDTYTVGYNLNGGTATNPTTYNVDTDTFTLNNPTRDGYEFIGWTGTGLNDYTNIVTIKEGSVGNRVYTANWQTTIVLHSNNGNNEQLTQHFINTNTGNINANTFTNGDYIFNGWSTSINGEVVYLDLASITLNQAYTDLYAVWGGTVGLTYALSNGAYSVTGYDGTEKDVVIQNEHRGLPVTSIVAEAFMDKIELSNITIASSIISVGRFSFKNITAKLIWDKPTIDIIGEYAFSCYKGTEIEVPSSVTILRRESFGDCRELTKLYFNAVNTIVESYYPDAFAYLGHNTDGVTVYVGKEVLVLNDKLFGGSTACNIKTVLFEEGGVFAGIERETFAGCGNLEVIEIPNSIKIIGKSAFVGCTKLQELTLPSASQCLGWYFCYSNYDGHINNRVPAGLKKIRILGGTTIAKEAYYYTNIEEIELPNSITTIYERAFSGKTKKVIYNGTIEDWCNLTLYDATYATNLSPLQYGAELYFGQEKAEEVVIPSTIKDIKPYAFMGCTSLTKVTIEAGVKSIGMSAFEKCINLVSIEIADSIETIGDRAFYGCTALTGINMPDSVENIGNYAFYDCETLSDVNMSKNITSVGSYAFFNCSALNSIEIPEKTTIIGERAFYNCAELGAVYYNAVESSDYSSSPEIFNCSSENGCDVIVTIASNVRKIPDYLCAYSNIKTVIFEENSLCESIGEYAFYGCGSLTSITIPESITYIGDQAFNYCSGVKEINFNATNCSNFKDTNNIFTNVGTKDVGITLKIGASVTRIPAYFSGGYTNTPTNKSYIKSIVFEDDSLCGSIGTMAFNYNDMLQTVTFGENSKITSIGSDAFGGCYNLTTVDFENLTKLENIGQRAFASTAITSITITETVTHIDNYAFTCRNISEVNYYAINCSAPEPGPNPEGVFYNAGNGNLKLTIGEKVKKINNVFAVSGYSSKLGITSVHYLGTVDQWCQIDFDRHPLTKNLHINGESVENIVISSAATKISDYAFHECTSLKSVVIENGVQEIGESAFYGCTELESVSMFDSIKTIGGHAFANCKKLNNLTIPNGVKTIGANAFSSCESLTSIVIPDSVTEIGSAAFYLCKSLESVVVGDGISILEHQLFEYCTNLNSIVIGSNVSEISSSVFEKCYQLTTIFTQNGLPSKIYNIDTDNAILKSATVYVFSAQTPNLNSDSTAYDGNYWHFVDDVPTIWVYTPEE